MRAIATALLLTLPIAAADQIVTVEHWRMRAGDDPHWAAPDFDDSTWQASHAPTRHNTSQPFFAGIRWYRGTADLPAVPEAVPLAIALPPIDEVFEVFIDGIPIGTFGAWGSPPVGRFHRFLAMRFPENLPRRTHVSVAIRRWTGVTRTNHVAFSSNGFMASPHTPEIGPASLLEIRQELRSLEAVHGYETNTFIDLALIAGGLLSLAAFLADRRRRENLWLALALLGEGVYPLLGIAAMNADVPVRSTGPALVVFLQFLCWPLWSVFLGTICASLMRIFRAAAAVQLVMALAIAAGFAWQLEAVPYNAIRVDIWIGMAAPAVAAVTLLRERRDRESVWLAGSLFLVSLAHLFMSQAFAWLGFSDRDRFLDLGSQVVDPRSLARLLFAIVALAILYLRHRREKEHQLALEQDLAAAHLVQESLLAGTRDNTPGFQVQASYLPAHQVGGDFYRILPGDDGSLLVVIGDVSGKGLEDANRLFQRILPDCTARTDAVVGARRRAIS
jgi:phosphoserine phosphatase RsbU/P